MKKCFPEEFFYKKFHFISDERTFSENIEIDSETGIRVRNEQDEVVTIPFHVTRDEQLSEKNRWIYGMVLNSPDDLYYQIEVKLHKCEPERDTVEVFLQAPPIIYKD